MQRVILRSVLLAAFSLYGAGIAELWHVESDQEEECRHAVCDEGRGPHVSGETGHGCPYRQSHQSSPPGPSHHDSSHCPLCQMLACLSAVMPAPQALPSIQQAAFERSARWAPPVIEAFIDPARARGPPSPALS
jgi:hypothetical protein